MEISNFYDDLSITDVQEKAAPVGDSLRVAVTKTSAQGQAAQSATPNLMSFSTDENSIWFNRKKYGVYILDSTKELDKNSTTEDIQSFLGDFTYDKWVDAVNRGNLVFIRAYNILYPVAIYSTNSELLQIVYNFSTSAILISITYSADKGYSYSLSETPLLSRGDVINSLNTGDPQKPLSAAMGKKLNDEKLAKTDVVNSLSDSSTNKALSAAQGKALNDKLSSNKISINFSAINNTSDSATIKGYMGNLDGTALVTKLTYGATLIDSSSEDWVITPQEVSASKVVFVGLKLQSFRIFTKTITVTISGSNYTNMAVITADRYVPNVVNNLTSSDTANALSAAQGKALNDKISALGSVYRIKGSKTNISEVLALTDAKVGDVWNVINAFTLNGKPFPASTNIVCITATSSSDHDEGNWDPIGGVVDLSPYAKKTEVEESDNEIWEQLGVVVSKDEIVNNLTSTNTDKPLSAAMGKQLNDEKISRSEIVNNLITNDSSKPLSAAQGKKLQDEKLSETDASNTYLTKTSAESTYAKKADGISHYSIGELTALSSNPTQEQLKTALGAPSAFRNAIDSGKLILVTGSANVQSQKSATCIIDSGNVIVKYLHPGNNDWTVIAKCVPASSGDNWDNAQFSVRIVKPLDSAGIIIE